jgi:hypothetical protein
MVYSHRVAGLLCLVLLAVVASPGQTAPLPVPPLAPVETGRYRALEVRTGARLWEEDWTLRQQLEGDQPVVSLTETGQGVRDSAMPTAWTLTMMIAMWGPSPRITARREVRDPVQHLLRVEDRAFNYAEGVGHLRTRDVASKKTAPRTVPLTASTIPVELLPAILRSLPEASDQTMRFELITWDGSVLHMEARILGQEDVSVPAGTYPCYRIQLTPTGLKGFFAGLLLPKFLTWHTVAAPHFWVKYQGPADGLGSPEIIRELLRFTTHE